jgi:hypothetical protein
VENFHNSAEIKGASRKMDEATYERLALEVLEAEDRIYEYGVISFTRHIHMFTSWYLRVEAFRHDFAKAGENHGSMEEDSVCVMREFLRT